MDFMEKKKRKLQFYHRKTHESDLWRLRVAGGVQASKGRQTDINNLKTYRQIVRNIENE
eukprot:UN33332